MRITLTAVRVYLVAVAYGQNIKWSLKTSISAPVVKVVGRLFIGNRSFLHIAILKRSLLSFIVESCGEVPASAKDFSLFIACGNPFLLRWDKLTNFSLWL